MLQGFAYRIKSTNANSAKYGACEVCRGHCSEVFMQTEQRGYVDPDTGTMGYTYHGAAATLFGHKDCVMSRQRLAE